MESEAAVIGSEAAAPAKVNPQELMAEIRTDWERANEAGRNAVQRAAFLTSPESRKEVDTLLAEKAALEKRLQEAKHRISEMETILNRYASVADPVVASDGFTYDRPQISSYVSECRAHGVPAISQQNQQEVSDRFIPNNSLKRLIEVLRPLIEGAPKAAAPAPVAVAPIG